jgi:transcriptional regulator with XRE-family HTH domain
MIKVVSKNIKKLRKNKNLSQEGLAFDSNISRRHMTNIEMGRVDVKLSTIIKISKALNVQPFELLLDN